MKSYKLWAVAMLIWLFAVASFAAQPHCRINVAKQQVVAHAYVKPYVYQQQAVVNYFVGQPIREEAIIEKALRSDPDWEAFKRFKQFKQLSNGEPADAATPPTEPIKSMLTKQCASCHSGDTPKGGLLLDGSAPLSCEDVLNAMKRVQAGEMPPKTELTPDEAGQVFEELLNLSPKKE